MNQIFQHRSYRYNVPLISNVLDCKTSFLYALIFWCTSCMLLLSQTLKCILPLECKVIKYSDTQYTLKDLWYSNWSIVPFFFFAASMEIRCICKSTILPSYIKMCKQYLLFSWRRKILMKNIADWRKIAWNDQ